MNEQQFIQELVIVKYASIGVSIGGLITIIMYLIISEIKTKLKCKKNKIKNN